MDLKRRLAQRRALEETTVETVTAANASPLAEPAEVPENASHQERVSRLRGMLDALIARQRTKEPAALPVDLRRSRFFTTGLLPGGPRPTPLGDAHVVSQILEPDHCHGKVQVARALEAKAEIVSRIALDEGLGAVDLRRMLFLDTETTGLSGGTGTIPFLIGIAWFDHQSLSIEQYLLRRPGEEGPMLSLLADKLRSASCLVTYNGKSYDWPLLRSRFVLSKIEPPEKLPHLDLLHCARRIFRRRLGETRLQTLEQRLLGFRRERDIDGYEIPSLYWSVVRGADPSSLTPIIEHNLNDIIALAAILAILAERYERLHTGDDPTDHLGLARVAARADDAERALRFAVAAAEGGGNDEITVEAGALAAKLALDGGDPAAARAFLEKALGEARGSPLLAAPIHLALSKLLEHRFRDPERALHHARSTALAEGPEAQQKRVRRLELRLARAAAATAREKPPKNRRKSAGSHPDSGPR